VNSPGQIGEQLDIASEFVNIVAGHAMGQLYGLGLGVEISPPERQPGPEVTWGFPLDADSVVIPVCSHQGQVAVVLSVRSP